MPFKDKNKANEWRRNHRRSNNSKCRAYDKARYDTFYRSPTSKWRKQNLRKYGLTVDQYLQMLSDQNGACAICGNKEDRNRNGVITLLTVDHNHHNGLVRGLLCSKCNTGLGAFMDDTSMLRLAINYLEKSEITK